MKAILIGFGDIAEKHLAVLKKFDCDVIGAVGRNYQKTADKAKKLKIPNVYESIENIPVDECDFLMNLTSADMVAETLEKLIPFRKPIFTEKPVGFGIKEIEKIISQNKKFQVPIMVGTNRRFYSIFHKGLEFLENHGKSIESIEIDTPENLSIVNNEKFNQNIKNNWMFANSIHSVDLIRFFGGEVKKINIKSDVQKSDFHATGECEKITNFVYSSNWKKTGKWKVSILADDIRIVFEPLEQGKIITKNNEENIIPSDEDSNFKPGFYSQFQHFLEYVVKNKNEWPASNLEDHKKSLHLVEQIFIRNNTI